MGLDIYFEKRKRNYEKMDEFKKVVADLDKLYSLPSEEFQNRMDEVDELKVKRDELNPRQEVAYFRKVNLLMPFFNYEGNCEYQEIAKCQVEDLIDACKSVLATKQGTGDDVTVNEEIASKILPTQAGFFFGGTEYDAWYVMGVEDVLEKFTEILKDTDWENEILEMYCWY